MALAALAVLHQETLPALDVAAGVDHESVCGGAGDLAAARTRPRHDDSRHPGVTITHWLTFILHSDHQVLKNVET